MLNVVVEIASQFRRINSSGGVFANICKSSGPQGLSMLFWDGKTLAKNFGLWTLVLHLC